MKNFKRLLCLCLALLMLLPVLVACKKDQPQSDGGETAAPGVASTDVAPIATDSVGTEEVWETDEKGYVKDSLDGVDLEGKEIRILCGNHDGDLEFHLDATEVKTAVDTALFTRNMTVESRLKCKLVWIDQYTFFEDTEYPAKAQELSTTGAVDIFGAYSLNLSTMMLQGLLADMKKSTTLELEKPYWNQKANKSCTIYDKMYFTAGDISLSTLQDSFVLSFNKELAEAENIDEYVENTFGYESMYDMVYEGVWTIDAMINIAKLITVDSDGLKNDGDSFGYAAYVIGTDGFYTGAGLKQLETAADGSIVISDDMFSEQTGDFCRKITDFLRTPSACVSDSIGAGSNHTLPEISWRNGKVLFFNLDVNYAISYTKDTQFGFETGILPMPKYDENQSEYFTTFGFTACLWGLARNSSSEYEDICAAFECLASEGYRTLTPVYFDTVAVGRQDSYDDHKMLYIIREAIDVEPGRVMALAFNQNTWMCWRISMRARQEYIDEANACKQSLNEQAMALNALVQQMEKIYS
ncbi:MAG: hypothetical protein E7668_02395 [Ruminococcaceae bacterium]|nr:hypothetical protein [Oscillospiraceae bacterium]